MLTKMRNFLPMFWKQLQTRKLPWVPALSAAEQTKLTWAKFIESYADVPRTYQDFFAPLLADKQAFPYTVLTPSREGFFTRVTEKLVCNFEHEIHVLEKSENSFITQCYPVDGISYVEVKSILLDSHIKISGITRQGIPASSTINFNSVGDYLFTPIVKNIRLATGDSKGVAEDSELDKFDHLIRSNYKFMNYARRSLLAGEKVIHFILQPEIRLPVIKILGKTYHRIISPTQMSILTNRELIMIRENEPRGRDISRYGGIWNYIQLDKIVSLTLNRKSNDLLVLSIKLPGNILLEFPFQILAKTELDQLVHQFHELVIS